MKSKWCFDSAVNFLLSDRFLALESYSDEMVWYLPLKLTVTEYGLAGPTITIWLWNWTIVYPTFNHNGWKGNNFLKNEFTGWVVYILEMALEGLLCMRRVGYPWLFKKPKNSIHINIKTNQPYNRNLIEYGQIKWISMIYDRRLLG